MRLIPHTTTKSQLAIVRRPRGSGPSGPPGEKAKGRRVLHRAIRLHDSIQVHADYRSRLLGWLLEEHVYLKRAIFERLPRVARFRIVVNERVLEVPFALGRIEGVRGPILDVGCADSTFPFMLAARGHDVVGLDIRPWSFPHPRFRFVLSDVRALPFRDHAFGGISMISSVEHVGLGFYGDAPDHWGDVAACREAWRVLAPGGLLVLTVPFGQRAISKVQRVYDAPALAELLDGWIVEERRFFVRENSQWLPAEEASAAARESVPETQAVALVAARRPSH